MQHPIAPGTTAGEKSVDLICDAVWCYIVNTVEDPKNFILFFSNSFSRCIRLHIFEYMIVYYVCVYYGKTPSNN